MDHLLASCVNVVCCAFAAAPSPGRADAPGLPPIDRRQGAALVGFARQAMDRYLRQRTGPDEIPIPSEIKVLRTNRNPVAITLRHAGAVEARVVRDGSDLCTNLAAAALDAMRSHKLPDRVDAKVLAARTIEVEVLSAPRPVVRSALAAAAVPGLSGLRYARGRAAEWVLPSAACVLGLDAEQMRRSAMGRFRLTPATASQPAKLGIFVGRHYVGFADGQILELFRGKDLTRREGLDDKALAAGASGVGNFLLRHQAKDGRYGLPQGPPGLTDALHAAYAMARLARHSGKAAFARSAAAAARHAASLLRRADGRALVPGKHRDETLTATAFLALTLGCLEADADRRRLHAELLVGLSAELGKMDPAKTASQPGSAASGPFLAFLAMVEGPPGNAQATSRLAALRRSLARRSPASAEARLWAYRAGLAGALPVVGPGEPAEATMLCPVPADALPDEKGGFAAGDGQPSAALTGLLAVCMAEALRRPGRPSAGEAAALRARLAEARRFCCRMMYQPREAYFAAEPDAWVGAVRAAPGAAGVTLPACAAAIEALLLE